MAALEATGAPVNSVESFKKTHRLALEGQNGFKKKLSLLGSTGSIGTQTLDICEEKPDLFEVTALAAGSNIDLLAEQIVKFKPKASAMLKLSSFCNTVLAESHAAIKRDGTQRGKQVQQQYIHASKRALHQALTGSNSAGRVFAATMMAVHRCIAFLMIAASQFPTLTAGAEGIVAVASHDDCDTVVTVGTTGGLCYIADGFPPGALRRIILTASGGAFRDWPAADLAKVTVADALKHPNWDMGAKITVDSATMMNKGLEVIEAHYLFGCDYDDIDIVVHPQSIIHSMVEAQDTSVIAQLGWADMRLPLLYSVSWPHRIRMSYKQLDLASLQQLTFKEADRVKYPCIDLAYA
eukprot:21314-Heterococcus_DN1.PRE.1